MTGTNNHSARRAQISAFSPTDAGKVDGKNSSRFGIFALPMVLLFCFFIVTFVQMREERRAQMRRNSVYREVEMLLQYRMNREAEMRTRRFTPQTEKELLLTLRAQFENGHYSQLLPTLRTYQNRAACWEVQQKIVRMLFQTGHVGCAYQLLLSQPPGKSSPNESEWENLQQELLAACEVTPLEETVHSPWRGKGLLDWQKGKECGIFSASGEKIRPELSFDAIVITVEGFAGRREERWMDFDERGNFRGFCEEIPKEAGELAGSYAEPHWQENDAKWELFGPKERINAEKWEEVTEFSEKGVAYGKKGNQWYCIRIPALDPEGRTKAVPAL